MPHISTLDLNQEYGKFVLEPLERGYGQTIGNALRRVLLSSIQGAAVAAVRIDKVFHEFAPIPGVKEDTTELLLNLKDLAIQVDTDGGLPLEDKVLRLDVQGPGRVTGADIVCPEGVDDRQPRGLHRHDQRRQSFPQHGAVRRLGNRLHASREAGSI